MRSACASRFVRWKLGRISFGLRLLNLWLERQALLLRVQLRSGVRDALQFLHQIIQLRDVVVGVFVAVFGVTGSARVSRAGECVSHSQTSSGESSFRLQRKPVSAGHRNQHARRVRYPEFAFIRTSQRETFLLRSLRVAPTDPSEFLHQVVEFRHVVVDVLVTILRIEI